jgi:hypothetical protein
LIAISSLTAISQLHFRKPWFGDEGMRAVACLTGLTYLDISDKSLVLEDYEQMEMQLSDLGARALGFLVRLPHLDIRGVDISYEGVRALSSLTALTCLHLNSSTVSEDGVKALTALTALTEICLDHTEVGDEGVKALADFTALSYIVCRLVCDVYFYCGNKYF